MGGGNSKPLGKLKGESLKEIKLCKQNLTDDVITQLIEALLSNASVRELCLEKCIIGGRELARLVSGINCSMCELRLDLSGTELGLEGVKILSPLLHQSPPRVHSLVLNECCLGDAGAAEICKHILVTEVELRNLELGSNEITSAGLKECGEVIGRGLIEGLSLFSNQLSSRTAGILTAGLPSSQSKGLSKGLSTGLSTGLSGSQSGGHSTGIFSGHSTSHSTGLQGGLPAFSPRVQSGVRLSWLSLGQNALGAEGCEWLVRGLKGSALLWLGMGGNAVGDTGAKAIADWLMEPKCELRSLGLSQNGITDRGAILLVRAMQTPHSAVRCLGLSHNFITDKTCQSLSQLLRSRTKSPVHFLTPQKTPLSTNQKRTLHTSSFNTLRDLSRTPQHATPLACPLSKLLLAGNQITDLGAALLAGAIAENSNLESLSLADTPMGDEGLICLGAALSPGNNLSLRSLDVQRTRVSPEAEQRFVRMLLDRAAPLKLGGPTLREREIARPKSGPLQRGASRLSMRSHRLSFRWNRVEEFQV